VSIKTSPKCQLLQFVWTSQWGNCWAFTKGGWRCDRRSFGR
jgi:hypothetical protein